MFVIQIVLKSMKQLYHAIQKIRKWIFVRLSQEIVKNVYTVKPKFETEKWV